jgi:hypothetical protein
MKIRYITTDLEFESASDLSQIVDELSNAVLIHHSDWIGDVYRVALGLADSDTTPDDAVSFYCSLVEKLSDSGKALWSGCTRRVVDIAFESGTEPESHTYQIPESLVRRVSVLGMSIAITIYRVGAYSAPPDE